MTLLTVSIPLDRLQDLDPCVQSAWSQGAEAIELRIDSLQGNPSELATYLQNHSDHTWIVTCRSESEGGQFQGSVEDRIAFLLTATRDTKVMIDFEWVDWPRHSEHFQPMASDHSPLKIILSSHDFKSLPDNLNECVDAMITEKNIQGCKVAYQANDICDSFCAIDLMHQHGSHVSAIAMGEDGLWSRILAKKFNAFATYCALDTDRTTAPGQITLHDMIHRYRWSDINQATKVYGVIGDPIAHSMSPLLFNRWFNQANINAVYMPLHVASTGGCIHRFLDGCRERRWLDVGGFSVTLPHKSAVLEWVGESADCMANWIGALNTIVIQDGQVKGYNTDCYAAISSLTGALDCDRSDLSGMKIDVLGAGGSARAILHGLREFGCEVTLFGRSQDKTKRVAEECECAAAGWDQRTNSKGEILINCTPVGLWPDFQNSPMPAEALSGYKLVFDLIYHPLETRLLRDARAAGAIALNGVDMFVRQAAMQFELWTGQQPDTQLAAQWIAEEINRKV